MGFRELNNRFIGRNQNYRQSEKTAGDLAVRLAVVSRRTPSESMTSWGSTVTAEFARGMHPGSLPCMQTFPNSGPNLNTNRRVSTMNAAPYDILKKDALGNPIWVEAVEDLRKATVRIEELALDSPGEYIVFNQQTSQIITTAGGSQRLSVEPIISAEQFGSLR
jgi:hypothetical protein